MNLILIIMYYNESDINFLFLFLRKTDFTELNYH